MIFNLVNEVANRPVKAISATEKGEEHSIDDLFVEWRSTAATGRATKAPRDAVLALFREAVDGPGDKEGPDFGLTGLTMRAERVLAALRGAGNAARRGTATNRTPANRAGKRTLDRMRPLRISIEGLRSFRAEAGIDFGDHTRVAVIGDTGAGKSSILEAMTYALYGQTSLGGKSKRELMNDTSDVMRVVLRFRVSGEEWEVTRVDRRAGGGGLRPPQAQLIRYGPAGETLDRVGQVRPVNERVQALIGLDSDAFLRTVILPQGRFARLLVEDAPSARTEILRQVWQTRDLEAAGDLAMQRLAEVRTLALRLRDEVERHPDDPEAHLASLVAGADRAIGRANTLANLRDRTERAADTLRKSEAAIAAARRADERVTPPAMDEMLGRLVPLERLQRLMEAEATELEGREAGLKRDLNGIPADDGPRRSRGRAHPGRAGRAPRTGGEGGRSRGGAAGGGRRRGGGGAATRPGDAGPRIGR